MVLAKILYWKQFCVYIGANFSQIITICLYGRVKETKRGTTQNFDNHLFVILLSSLHEKMQSATHMDDPSLYNNVLTDAELRVGISFNITAVRRTDCRINEKVKVLYSCID